MKTSLRAPAESDYEAIASWITDAEACLRWAGPRLSFPFLASDLPALLAIPGGNEFGYCLVDESGAPCGFGQHWVLQPDAVHIGRIIVAPAARGQGLGRVLCQQLISTALAETSATVVTLRVYRDNLAAARLYSSLGFSEVADQSSNDVLFMKMLANPSFHGE